MGSIKNAFLVEGVRTAIGSFRGGLSAVRADDLGAVVLKALMERVQGSVDPARIDDVYMGCANQAGEDNRNVARMALLLAGLPHSVPGETINRLCASGMSAGMHAARAIACGEAELVIAGGLEQMTRGPWVMSKSAQPFGSEAQLFDSSFGWRFVNPAMQAQYGTEAMGETAENLVEKYGIRREDQDAFALRSQQKAAQAQAKGIFREEIVPVSIPQRKGDPVVFEADEFIKPFTSMEGLSALRPAFRKGGSVTAGNASGLNDGACANLFASEQAVQALGLQPLARVVASGVAGVEPSIMGIGPVPASALALKRAGLRLEDMDLIELNEAFAGQALACMKEMGIDFEDPRVNPHGGAIALGHPLGMSGARLLMTAARELKRSQKRYALCTMCIGVGQGFAVVLERV
jgi:acetyl-CoA acyltransferase